MVILENDKTFIRIYLSSFVLVSNEKSFARLFKVYLLLCLTFSDL